MQKVPSVEWNQEVYVPRAKLEDLPPPPPGKRGWPWTVGSEPYPKTRCDGSPWPSLRVVTPSFRQPEYIEETIRSVLLQGYPCLEYFVIDGGSQDGSVEIIERYSPWLSGWKSEIDNGQVDAIKKGLRGAKTDFFTWLNSDDLFDQNALFILANAQPGQGIAGKVTNFDMNGSVQEKVNSGLSLQEFARRWSSSVFHQPGVFWPEPSQLYEKIDEDLHYAFDEKLLLWCMFLFGAIKETEHPVAFFRLHGSSKTVSQANRFLPEKIAIIKEFHSDIGDMVSEAERRGFCDLYWSLFLANEMNNPSLGAVGRILSEMVKDPTRLSRETLGAIRRIIPSSFSGFRNH